MLLVTFLSRLFEDPKLQQDFSRDPDGTMQKAGLTREQRETVMSQDEIRVGHQVARELTKAEYRSALWFGGELTINGINPNHGKRGPTPMMVTVTGSYFDEDAVADIEFVEGKTWRIPINDVKVSGAKTESSSLTGTLTLDAQIPPGQWTLRVTNISLKMSVPLPNAFTVI